jgi:hypothetical protein
MTKLFISLNERGEARQSWIKAAERIGVDVAGYIDGPYVLPLSNRVAKLVASMQGVNYMDSATFDILSDCKLRAAHLPAVPAASSETEVLALTSPIFLKPRLNLYKGTSPLAYTRWASGAALHASAWREFQASDLDLGGLVAVPDLGNPLTVLEVDFSVNKFSEIYITNTFSHGFTDHNKPTTFTSGAPAPTVLIEAISTFCEQRGITGGIFDVQAVQHEGLWKIMDWNVRPPGWYRFGAGEHSGVADACLAHMLGLPVDKSPVYIEQRSYWDNPMQNSEAGFVRSFGLVPSWVWNTNFIGRVCGIGDTKEDVQAKFDAMEAARP